ncbi:bifunctional 4-hydroxy-2-oxoglutarate aldolase/2-dehydro-3-deoxy-phosphogluconate aldolase [Erythrobacter sp. JK5]|uniref:bifunctional 4-hydroxy-2-oxoglutarate aldolase/2-dehydro-3-deoxy-phosphogluconate aldolase n=1 Tax=Erythrobacter sp. JK5 TaxID=2829500 RepID=UPI001BA63A64|nr:bifunctional 4-hydroxy-2-oxoglutarate aldolase/2-dehydro-3-deoxy-phosphogluconate aldolase [Erythrobacter sp. JK5]QUL38011.1 bifunctional 4-hydroxy-2-oxoglutarate aldolase/2-dehydro-3-deoxy-phosphogluconate aldolase [Erythrobacter sp. JK5]
MSTLADTLQSAPVVPLVNESDPGKALATAEALKAGGLGVIEVVLRSDGALEGMKRMLAEGEGMIVGAGTVLTLDMAKEVHQAGAEFIVCPGLVDDIAHYCIDQKIPFYPGTMTAGEVQRAYALGLREVKFFPASLAGGVPMLKAFASVFREMRFMPTGGVSAGNLAEFLAVEQVLACGGSWLTPKDAVGSGDFAAVTRLAEEAVAIARAARGSA